jgi:hypothetical protein
MNEKNLALLWQQGNEHDFDWFVARMEITKALDGLATIDVLKKNQQTGSTPFEEWLTVLIEVTSAATLDDQVERAKIKKAIEDAVEWWFESGKKGWSEKHDKKMNEIMDKLLGGFNSPKRKDAVELLFEAILNRSSPSMVVKDRMALIALESGAFVSMERLVKRKGVDINQDVARELEDGGGHWRSRWYRESDKNGLTLYRKLAFFAKSVEAVDALTNLGVDWEGVAKGQTQSVRQDLSTKSVHKFESTEQRNKVFKAMVAMGRKKVTSSAEKAEHLFESLKDVDKMTDLAAALLGLKWEEMRDKAGNNVMHVLAMGGYKRGVCSMLRMDRAQPLALEKNSEGLTPIEMLLTGRLATTDRLRADLEKALSEWGYIKPTIDVIKTMSKALGKANESNWAPQGLTETTQNTAHILTSNFYLVEQQLTKELVFGTPEEVLKQMKSSEGEALVKQMHALLKKGHCHLGLWAATRTKENKLGFISRAETKMELEFAVLSLMGMAHSTDDQRFNVSSYVKNALKGAADGADAVIEKAIKMGVDVVQLKETTLKNVKAPGIINRNNDELRRGFESLIPCWSQIEMMQDNMRLKVKLDGAIPIQSTVVQARVAKVL